MSQKNITFAKKNTNMKVLLFIFIPITLLCFILIFILYMKRHRRKHTPFSFFRWHDEIPPYDYDNEKETCKSIVAEVEKNSNDITMVRSELVNKFIVLLGFANIMTRPILNTYFRIKFKIPLPKGYTWDFYYFDHKTWITTKLFIRKREEPRILDENKYIACYEESGNKFVYHSTKKVSSLSPDLVFIDPLEQLELPFSIESIWQAFCIYEQSSYLKPLTLYKYVMSEEEYNKLKDNLENFDCDFKPPYIKFYQNKAILYYYAWHDRMGYIFERIAFIHDGKHFKVYNNTPAEVLYNYDRFEGLDHVLIV